MHVINVFNAELPDDIKLAIIAHKHSPVGSGERIFAQNYLISRGLMKIVDQNNDYQSRESDNV